MIYALTRGREIGVDIEQVRSMSDQKDIIERFCSEREKIDFRSVPEDLKSLAFFNCWTRKEAFIKACGEGLTRPLDEFTVSLIPGDRAELLSAR